MVGFSYGIRRYFMKEDCLAPSDGYTQLILKNHIKWGNDIRYAAKTNSALKSKDLSVYYNSVMSPQRFSDYMEQRSNIKKSNKTQENNKKAYINNSTVYLEKGAAREQLRELYSKVTPTGIRTMNWFVNKMLRNSVQSLNVH
jgi:phage antirepressor YoqD-like protein